jgi:hypothetical protein
MNRLRILLTASLLVLAFCCAAGTAPTLHPQESACVPSTLTDDGLRQMLDTMGYEPKALSKGYLIAVKDGTWTLNVQLVLSENKSKLGLNANAGIVENPDAVTAAEWRALLISNGDIEPTIFYYDAEKKKLYIHRVLDNRGLTPAVLRKEIETFCGNIKSTADLWKFTK